MGAAIRQFEFADPTQMILATSLGWLSFKGITALEFCFGELFVSD
jgi:hypothetical protein